jgi:hypothetical protein
VSKTPLGKCSININQSHRRLPRLRYFALYNLEPLSSSSNSSSDGVRPIVRVDRTGLASILGTQTPTSGDTPTSTNRPSSLVSLSIECRNPLPLCVSASVSHLFLGAERHCGISLDAGTLLAGHDLRTLSTLFGLPLRLENPLLGTSVRATDGASFRGNPPLRISDSSR